MAKQEAKFTAELRVAFEALGAWAYKIPDMPRYKGQKRRNVPRPFDLAVCLDGRLIAVEVKQMQGFKAFGPRMMQPSQVEHLTKVEAVGGDSFVALFVHGKGPRFVHLFVFPWSDLLRRWDHGSIKAKELRTLNHADWTRTADRHLEWVPSMIAEYRAWKAA